MNISIYLYVMNSTNKKSFITVKESKLLNIAKFLVNILSATFYNFLHIICHKVSHQRWRGT